MCKKRRFLYIFFILWLHPNIAYYIYCEIGRDSDILWSKKAIMLCLYVLKRPKKESSKSIIMFLDSFMYLIFYDRYLPHHSIYLICSYWILIQLVHDGGARLVHPLAAVRRTAHTHNLVRVVFYVKFVVIRQLQQKYRFGFSAVDLWASSKWETLIYI